MSPKFVLLLVMLPAIFYGPLLYYGFYFIFRGPLPLQVETIAHRGAPVSAQENTISAFRAAARAGADRLELDVQLTKDGVPVVFHDDTLERAAGKSGWLGDFSAADILALDLGDGEKIPTLDAVTALARETNTALLVDIKRPARYPGIEKKVLDALRSAGWLERSMIQSFDGESLDRLHALDASAHLCRLYEDEMFGTLGPQAGDAQCVGFPAFFVLIYPRLISLHHGEGRVVLVWFDDKAPSLFIDFVRALGVDGLIVDDLSRASMD